MNQITKRKVVRNIILNQRFLQLKYISMAIDHTLDKIRKEDRYSHSIEVANCCEIMNDSISEKLGVITDYKNTAYIVGLLHDLGHTAGGHEGERALNKMSRKYSHGKISFDGNSNNYVVIEKSNMLEGVSLSDQEYILASLAKHPELLYIDQKHIKEYIEKSVKADKVFFTENGISSSKMNKTIQCQIMDIADENCYIVSDIIDSRNILTTKELSRIFRKEFPRKVSQKLINSLYSSKSTFVSVMQEYFFLFSENFTFIEGVLVPENKEIEEIRQTFAKINRKYVLSSKKIKEVRTRNKLIINEVFNFFFKKENIEKIPSRFYKNEIKKASSRKERIRLTRDMLGSLTDKGIKKLYYKEIKNGNN